MLPWKYADDVPALNLGISEHKSFKCYSQADDDDMECCGAKEYIHPMVS